MLASLPAPPRARPMRRPGSTDTASASRLIAGAATTDATALRAGIEIRLQPGWQPIGAIPAIPACRRASISPARRISKSREVRCPAPQLFTDETGDSIGYRTTSSFRSQVVPHDAGKPVTLRLKLDYAVCEKLCVPAEASAELDACAPAPSARGCRAHCSRGARAASRSPPPQAALTASGASTTRPKPLVVVDLAAPSGKPVDLFAEGPTPEWALPVPKPAPGAPDGRQHFTLRARRPAARRQIRRARRTDLHRGRRRARHRGHDPSRLIRRARALITAGTRKLPNSNEEQPCPSRSATDCPKRNSAS